ncbi:MAG: transporter [Acidobacteria bacterium]|nr:transporter [Acidobacteriota bacterium]
MFPPLRGCSCRTIILAVAVLLTCGLSPSALAQQSYSSTGNRPDDSIRLFQRFIQDGAITPHVWLEGQARFQSNSPIFNGDEAERRLLGTILALGLTEDLEIGLTLGVVSLDPDNGGSESGLSDMQIYAKYRINELPLSVTLGGIVKIPTADEDEGLGTGEVDIEGFIAVRKSYGHVDLIGNGGVRFNQDPEIGDIDGRTSILLGGGVIIAMTQTVFNTWELNFESKRYERTDSSTTLTPGLMWRVGDRGLIRAGIGIGLTDGAPDFEAIGGFVLSY